MNELKPEDVMRALECCVRRECMPCPNKERRTGITECMECLMQDALALLREKDSEIERLILQATAKHEAREDLLENDIVEILTLRQEVEEKDAEIERLKQEHKDYIEDVTAMLSEKNTECERLMRENTALECIVSTARNRAKAYTVRKMYEKLKEKYTNHSWGGFYVPDYMIDQIAKEMLEVSE